MELGIKGYKELTVTDDMLAKNVGSGLVAVYATPMMIAGIEGTAAESVAPYLEEGRTTVGTLMNVEHVSATPVGMRVTAESELTEIDGRRLVFTVKAFDDAGLIGTGTHERFIVVDEKFVAKAAKKRG